MEESRKRDKLAALRVPSLDRRDMMKMGLGAGVAMTQLLKAPLAGAQEKSSRPADSHADAITFTTAGWVNTSGRASGNGPMDESTRRIVEFVDKYDASQMSDSLVETINYATLDTIASLVTGFESEPARILARMGKVTRSDMNCTILGYGIVTTPELAAFANAGMIRHADFNVGAHNTEMFGGVYAIAEAVKATGPETMVAMALTYEVINAIGVAAGGGDAHPGGWDAPYHSCGTAMACGKLLKLNQDQLANALSLALVPHMPMYSHIGVQSMWKGSHSAEQVRLGVWAALMARAGLTAPSEPFEGRDGLYDHLGSDTREMKIPADPGGMMSIEKILGKGGNYKRFATEGSTQSIHEKVIPNIHKWAKPEEIAAIDIDFPFFWQQEIADPQKWDPRNRETADHSLPYNVARAIIDGYIYLDSFSREKYMDPKVRELMAKITVYPDYKAVGQVPVTITVTKKSGEVLKQTASTRAPMTRQELLDKYNKAFDFREIDKAQRDRAREQWMNLKTCKDITGPIQTIAKFGKPRPLSDMSPGPIS